MAQTPDQISTGAACFKSIDVGRRLSAILYLTNTQGATPNNIALLSSCYYPIDEGRQLAVLIYLYNTISGKNLSLEQLTDPTTGYICYNSIPFADQDAAVIYLLNTGNLTVDQVSENSICYSAIDYGRQMAAWIFLANINISGPNATIDQLMQNSACFNNITLGQQLAAIVFLLS